MTTLSLPRLTDVPKEFVVPGDSTWCSQLLLSLIDGGAMLPVDFVGRPTNAAELLKNALRRHWLEITRGERIFRWNLGVQLMRPHPAAGAYAGCPWLAIYPPQDERGWFPCEPYFIGPAITQLETAMKGLGQTVLAVFYDALVYLPNTLTPRDALWQCSATHWYYCSNEEDALREIASLNDITVERAREDYAEIPSRADIFGDMPTWATGPRRVISDPQVRTAAARDSFARKVVQAIDTIVAIVHTGGPFADCGHGESECDSVAWCAWFRWSPTDQAPRILDDWTNEALQGDYIEAATAVPCPPGEQQAAEWLTRMRSTAKLARAIENLVDLIGERP
ncbi:MULTISPECIES: PRTRC system protein F [Cupriavidus]